MAIPIVTFIGRSGSGKTTLLEKLVKRLKSRGYRVATIKHHSHASFEIDVPGKDSWRFARAGSDHVIIVAPDQIASYRKIEREPGLEEVAAGISDVDIILVEGYKNSNQPQIEVLRTTNNQDIVGSPEQRIALVSDLPLDIGVPRFALDDVDGIALFLEERFLRKAA